MTDGYNAGSLLTVAAVVIGVVVVAGGAGAAGAGTNHGASGNYEVVLPQEVDHYPGDQNRANASIQHLAGLEGTFDGTPSPKGYEVTDFLIIGNPDITFSSCSTENTAAFGVDRENDDAGTETDESLLAARKNSQFNDHEIVIEFFGEDDLAGDPIAINDVDQVVAVQNECYTMPEEPGWYQIGGFLNGTGYNGNQFEVTLDSHYFYICECGSEAEAREQLGPPPSEEDGTSESTPTATAEETAERTTTATAEQTATAERTATATAGSNNDGGTQAQSSAQQSGPATPTVGAGPGFGVVAALGGLLAVALLAFRRD